MITINSSLNKQFKKTRLTIANINWLRNCTSDQLLELIEEWAEATNPGDQFTIRERLRNLCDHIPASRFRGACRRFKNRVAKKLVTTVYYLIYEKRDNSFIYMRK